MKIKKGAEFKMEAFSDHNRELEELEAIVEGRTLKSNMKILFKTMMEK